MEKQKTVVMSIEINRNRDSYTAGVPPEIFARIAQQFPEYLAQSTQFVPEPYKISLQRPREDLDLQRLLEFAKGVGARIRDNLADCEPGVHVSEFEYYTEAEIQSASYLNGYLSGPEIAECDKEPLGTKLEWLVKEDERLKRHKSKSLGRVWAWDKILVRDELKEALDAEGFNQLVFKELKTVLGVWPKDIPKLYMITSDLILPPNELKLFDNCGRIFPSSANTGQRPDGCYLLDGYLQNAQLTYARSKIECSTFDFASTYEWFGTGRAGQPRMVYSQRFRKFCVTHKLKGFEWTPVRVLD